MIQCRCDKGKHIYNKGTASAIRNTGGISVAGICGRGGHRAHRGRHIAKERWAQNSVCSASSGTFTICRGACRWKWTLGAKFCSLNVLASFKMFLIEVFMNIKTPQNIIEHNIHRHSLLHIWKSIYVSPNSQCQYFSNSMEEITCYKMLSLGVKNGGKE